MIRRERQVRLIPAREGIQGQGLLDLIADLPSGITMVEIGCFMGDSALLFLNSGKIKKFYAVDTWRAGRFDNAERAFDKAVANRGVEKLKMTMISASALLPKVDFVYIDGDHSYEWVKLDIKNSLAIIKSGGVIAGHDYAPNYKDKVVKAVDEILGTPDKVYKDTSWLKYIT